MAHITDLPNVLPNDRNNCRGGDEGACMYYNSGNFGHYNYTAEQGAGDPLSPAYSCQSNAFDAFNEEGVYEDKALGNLGAYNAETPYGDINGAKGFYGSPEGLSYPAKPTCSGFKGPSRPPANADYMKWDKYYQKAPQGGIMGMGMGMGMMSLFYLLLAAIILYYLSTRNVFSRNQIITVIVALAIFYFFFSMNM